MPIPVNPTQANSIKKPTVNAQCIGCGLCTALASHVFKINAMGTSEVIPAEQYDEKMIDEAIRSCPVNAIGWETSKKA